MNELHKAIYNKVVQPALKQIAPSTRAVVTEYDGVNNICTVEFHSPLTEGTVEMKEVPVQIGSGGFHSAGPFKGDEVWLNFVNGDYKLPQIVALADRHNVFQTRENRNKHQKKGVYVPDTICNR